MRPREVHDGSPEVGADRDRIERRKMGRHPHEGVLHEIVRRLPVAGEEEREPAKARGIAVIRLLQAQAPIIVCRVDHAPRPSLRIRSPI